MSSIEEVSTRSDAGNGELDRLLDDLRRILIDGIKHGFFDGEITVRAPRSDRREVLISVGKSYKYIIKTDDLPH